MMKKDITSDNKIQPIKQLNEANEFKNFSKFVKCTLRNFKKLDKIDKNDIYELYYIIEYIDKHIENGVVNKYIRQDMLSIKDEVNIILYSFTDDKMNNIMERDLKDNKRISNAKYRKTKPYKELKNKDKNNNDYQSNIFKYLRKVIPNYLVTTMMLLFCVATVNFIDTSTTKYVENKIEITQEITEETSDKTYNTDITEPKSENSELAIKHATASFINPLKKALSSIVSVIASCIIGIKTISIVLDTTMILFGYQIIYTLGLDKFISATANDIIKNNDNRINLKYIDVNLDDRCATAKVVLEELSNGCFDADLDNLYNDHNQEDIAHELLDNLNTYLDKKDYKNYLYTCAKGEHLYLECRNKYQEFLKGFEDALRIVKC